MKMQSRARRFGKAAGVVAARLLSIAAVLVAAAGASVATGVAAEQAVKLPPPALDLQPSAQAAVFAGGCFWGVQAVFQHTQGVLGAVSGYAGGQAATANYEAVGSGATGHAEAVEVHWDPRRISYGKLLQIYFSVAHDPTQLDRQGPDAGPQYRSAIFYADAAQRDVAQRYIAQLDAAHVFPRKIVTQLAPLSHFYPAEDYHQDYATLHPESPYIAAFDRPKIANLKATLPEWYREKPVLVGRH
jgi:peptide-methionine (S)-S-oxide reductase